MRRSDRGELAGSQRGSARAPTAAPWWASARACVFLLTTVGLLPATDAHDSTPLDPLWTLATDSYRDGQFDTGHLHLKTLIDSRPGDVRLTTRCLERMLDETERQRVQDRVSRADNRWAVYAARRICALERSGALSSHSVAVHDAVEIRIDDLVQQRRRLEAAELIDRLVEENASDLSWRIRRAQLYREFGSFEARALFDQLLAEIDLDHPNAAVRRQWTQLSKSYESARDRLPPGIQPLPASSPLPLLALDALDIQLPPLGARAVADRPVEVDRLAAELAHAEDVVEWRDGSGWIDPVRALDLHLSSLPRAALRPLGRAQAELIIPEASFAQFADAEVLLLARRFPWGLPAQERLLVLAGRSLWEGRVQSALRSFEEILDHGLDERLRAKAQVGYWTALAQADRSLRVADLLGDVDPSRRFAWFGTLTEAGEICRQLIENGEPRQRTLVEPSLDDLAVRVVHLPARCTGFPHEVDLVVDGGQVLVSAPELLTMYSAEAPGSPIWTIRGSPQVRESRLRKFHRGFFRPSLDAEAVYTRFGYGELPDGVAVFDRSTGRTLWFEDCATSRSPGYRTRVPLGDPALSDGRLYYLLWSSRGDLKHRPDRRLSVACFDLGRRVVEWERAIALAGHSTDLTASLFRARPETAIAGNRVTIHRGAIYSSSSCGLVARSDVRDGRTDWVHCYRDSPGPVDPANRGSPPVIAGDKVVFLPRDSNRVFALDQRSGRLVWENSLISAVQIDGIADGRLIVSEPTSVAGLDPATGKVSWYRLLDGPVLGPARVMGSTVYVPRREGLLRLSAATGDVVEGRPWRLGREEPQAVAIEERAVFVVTNEPSPDPSAPVGQPLNPSASKETPALELPLAPAWSLRRDSPRISAAPVGTRLDGLAYVLSGGVLECVELSARGGVLWKRFCDSDNPSFHFADDVLLVVSRGSGGRVVAYDGRDGRVRWETALPEGVKEHVRCGRVLVFHDGARWLRALDSATGRWEWARNLGPAHLTRIVWAGEILHVVCWSSVLRLRHLSLDARSGRTVGESLITPAASKDIVDGRLRKDGFYEVRTRSVRGRFVRLVALSEIHGRGWTSITELEVIGRDGMNLPRDLWRVRHVDSWEPDSSIDESPQSAIDGDPTTWWHTKWKGGVPGHPHEIQIDLGESTSVAGIRYLPGNIPSNNGTIRDYELYTSDDGESWSTPLAKGVLVGPMRVKQLHVTGSGVVVEASFRRGGPFAFFVYALDGAPANPLEDGARFAFAKGPYLFLVVKNDRNEDVLTARRFDDPTYRFELGAPRLFDAKRTHVIADRLVGIGADLVIADLKERRMILRPSGPPSAGASGGFLLRQGPDHLLRVVPGGREGNAIVRLDLSTGRLSDPFFDCTVAPLQDPARHRRDGSLARVGRVLLLEDGSSVRAWIGRVDRGSADR